MAGSKRKMPAEQGSNIKGVIDELWKVYQALYDGYDEIERLDQKWTKDGKKKHAEAALARTTNMVGRLLTVRKMMVNTCHPLMLKSDVLRLLNEICSVLETALKEASERREYILAHPEEVEEVVIADYPMDLIYGGWYDVAERDKFRLDLDLLVLENNWLREHVGSSEASICERSGIYLPEPELTDTEGNMVEALGTSVLKGPELLKHAGYCNNSHSRQILSNLTKRGILRRSVRGYYNPREVQEDPIHS